jgi:hypothetical protein
MHALRALFDEPTGASYMANPRDSRSDLSPRKVADRLKDEGKQRLERGKATAAEQVDQVANALKNAGDELGGQSTLGNYANQFAGSIGRLGSRLRDSSIEDLATDMQAAARRNPGLFVLGGLTLGIVLARLAKASAPEMETVDEDYDELSSGGLSASSSDENYRGDVTMPDQHLGTSTGVGSAAGSGVGNDLGTDLGSGVGSTTPSSRTFGG